FLSRRINRYGGRRDPGTLAWFFEAREECSSRSSLPIRYPHAQICAQVHPSPVLPSSRTGLRELETTFTGKRIDLHAGYDHSASFKHMGRPTSGRWISRRLVRVFGLRIALALVWNTTEGQKHLFTLYRLDRLRQRCHYGRHYLRVNC